MSLSRFQHGISSFGVPLPNGGDMTIGNVYFVCQNSAKSWYANWESARIGGYDDGSDRLHTTIANALSATATERNDYVIVMPDADEYDLTATLTMNKANVHLLCPGGMHGEMGANNSGVLDMNTTDTATITLTGANCEIAGFKFNRTSASTLLSTTGDVCVPTANTGHAMEIHHNTFEGPLSGSDNAAWICCYNGGSGNRCSIHHNIFRAVNPSTSMSYGVYLSTAYGTFINNLMIVQNGVTITWGVRMNGSGGIIAYNTFAAIRAGAGLSAGSFTGAMLIDTNDQTAVIGNRGAVGTGTLIDGGTADTSWCDNRSGVNGGVLCVDQDIDA